METIKDYWYALVDTKMNKITAVYPTREDAQETVGRRALPHHVERVRVIIDRIKT